MTCSRLYSSYQPLQAIKARAQRDGTTVASSLSDTDLNAAASAAAGKDVALVFITGEHLISLPQVYFMLTIVQLTLAKAT